MSLKQLTKDPTYSAHEQTVQTEWHNTHLYDDLIKKLEQHHTKKINFCDGPPFVSGNLHFGSLLQSYIKSTIFNYNILNDTLIYNNLSYDCHGIPLQTIIDKKLNLKSKKDILEYGIEKYIDECKKYIDENSTSWQPLFESIGRLHNSKQSTFTCSTNYMESVWFIFNKLYEKNLIYIGTSIQPYSTACYTSFSQMESTQNYKDVDCRSLYVYLPLIDDENTGIVIWTTTPWTLVFNVSVCVNPDALYVKLYDGQRYYIVCENHVKNLQLKQILSVEQLGKGSNLFGKKYKPLFNYLLDIVSFHQIITDQFVDCNVSDTGTGVVHLAPSNGQTDFEACLKNGFTHQQIMQLCQINDDGTYTDKMGEFSGKLITSPEVEKQIIIHLKNTTQLVRNQQIKHRYPHCYRSETPLIYRAIESVFIKVTDIKERMVEIAEKINWAPDHIKHGRFKKWLEGAKDWNISRNTTFGNPIPLWISEDKEEIICVSSIEELYQLSNVKVNDLHVDTIDKILIPSKKGKGMLKRIPYTMDCWVESACAPYAQIHYPFENRHLIENDNECIVDFVSEGLDQVTNWFYVLHVISTALFDKPAFKNVICSGLICAADGKKLSKRLGNYTDPLETFQKYGADYVRLYMLGSPAVKADTLNFNDLDVEKIKQRIIPYINAIKFMLEHIIHMESESHKFNYIAYKTTSNMMDKWIISRTGTLLKSVKQNMELYKIDSSVYEILNFVDDLTNWYVKFNRDRMKGHLGKDEQQTSLSTLNYVLYNYNIIMAPFTPLLSEYLYKYLSQLQSFECKTSIFKCDYPIDADFIDEYDVEERMKLLQKIAGIVRTMRSQEKQFSSSRVPISKVIIEHIDEQLINDIQLIANLIQDEVNCIEIECRQSSNTYKYQIEINQKNMGKKFKKDNNLVQKKLSQLSQEDIQMFYECGTYSFDEFIVENNNDVVIQKIPTSISSDSNVKTVLDGELMISVDFTYSQQILNTHLIRLFITKVQQLRKQTNLHPWNPIIVFYDDTLNQLFTDNKQFIESRLLCQIDYIGNIQSTDKPYHLTQQIELNDIVINVVIVRLD